MSREIMTKDISDAILGMIEQNRNAKIFEGTTQKPFEVQSITLALDTAATQQNPYIIGFPFKSVYIAAATDTVVGVNLFPNAIESFQSSIPLKQNDSWIVDEPVAKAFLTWSAQAGKTITLIFFVSSMFQSGSQLSISGGGVSISEGTTFTTSQVALTAATATLVAASLSTRKLLSVQNNTGADVWFGGVSVSNTGTNQGLRISPGAILQWRNTAALYAYSIAGGSGDSGLTIMSEV